MLLKDFIKTFICPNTLIRLQYEVEGGHEEVPGKWPKTEHEILKLPIIMEDVIGVTDILYDDNYKEAVNIVITRNIVGNLNIEELNPATKKPRFFK